MNIRVFLALAFFTVAGIVFYLGAQWNDSRGVFSNSPAPEHLVTYTLPIADITQLLSEGVSDVEIVCSARDEVVIAYDSSTSIDKTSVDGSRLSLRFDMERVGFFSFAGRANPKIKVYTQTLDSLVNKGAGRISTSDTFRLDNVWLINEGVGSIEYLTNAKYLMAKNTGVGSIRLTGMADMAYIDNNGIGSISAHKLTARHVKAYNNGMGSVSVFGKDSLSLSNNGLGSMKYNGDGKVYHFQNNGMGSISN